MVTRSSLVAKRLWQVAAATGGVGRHIGAGAGVGAGAGGWNRGEYRCAYAYAATAAGGGGGRAGAGAGGEGEALDFWSLILFGPCIFTAGLGLWQLQRYEWKSELLQLRKSRLYDEPVDFERLVSPSGAASSSEGAAVVAGKSDLEYRRVLVKGALDAEKAVFIGPRMHRLDEGDSKSAERGYLWIAPVDLSNGQTTALINMGWVPQQWRNDHMQYIELKEKGEDPRPSKIARRSAIEELAIVRKSENPTMFVPENEPAKKEWFYIDSKQISKQAGLPVDSTLLEAIDDDTSRLYKSPFPARRVVDDFLSFSVMPNDHLLYAATWFVLCTAVSYLAYKRLKTR